MLGRPWGCLDPEVVGPRASRRSWPLFLPDIHVSVLEERFSLGLLGSAGGCELAWLHRCLLGAARKAWVLVAVGGQARALALEYPGSAGWMEGRPGLSQDAHLASPRADPLGCVEPSVRTIQEPGEAGRAQAGSRLPSALGPRG